MCRKELLLHVLAVVSSLLAFKESSCSFAADCPYPSAVLGARIVFVVCSSAIGLVSWRMIKEARRRDISEEVNADIAALHARNKKIAVKCCLVLFIHVHFGLVPPLVASSLMSIIGLPVWWEQSSYWHKYGKPAAVRFEAAGDEPLLASAAPVGGVGEPRSLSPQVATQAAQKTQAADLERGPASPPASAAAPPKAVVQNKQGNARATKPVGKVLAAMAKAAKSEDGEKPRTKHEIIFDGESAPKTGCFCYRLK